MNQAVLVSKVVPSSFCELWDANVSSPCALCARFLIDNGGCVKGRVEEPDGTTNLDAYDDAGSEEPVADPDEMSDCLETFHEANEDWQDAEADPLAWMDCQEFFDSDNGLNGNEASADDANDDANGASAEEEYDAYNLSKESRHVLREIDVKQDPEKKVSQLLREAYSQGRRNMRSEIGADWRKMSVFIAYTFCKSMNVYESLRMLAMYNHRQPFKYEDPLPGERKEVEPRFCSRLLSANLTSSSPDIFKWKQAALKNPANEREISNEIAYWTERIQSYLQEHMLPEPLAITFVPDTRHGRGNSFLLVFVNQSDAAAVRTRLTEIYGAHQDCVRN
jgi:hypothetical protein